jgi:hypothetical protein
MAGGGASGGGMVLTNRHHAGMDKNEHCDQRQANVISACRWPAKTIHKFGTFNSHQKEIFVSNGMMKQGRVGARVGFDGIRDLKSVGISSHI